MGVIFSRIWRLFGSQEHKVILVGLDNAGKTTILYQFLSGETVQTSPTIGSNVEEIRIRNLHFIMWDIGGQESLRTTWSMYYTHTEFVILVIDSTDLERLPIVRDELSRMLRAEELVRAKLIVLANKQDARMALSAADISKQLNLTSIKDHVWFIQSCCALSGEGLPAALEWMAQHAKR